MNRRHLMNLFTALGFGAAARAAKSASTAADKTNTRTDRVDLPDAEWKKRLPPAAYDVLRHEATERPWSSALNAEKRAGTYQCAGCELPLFAHSMKFDSGTGWPSFFAVLPDALQTRTDFKMILPRTEYHCARCGGHQGHVFDDGPKPSGKRYCNNGVALRFVEQTA
jgi:peptide-methionine (R)-S-oxide reductase